MLVCLALAFVECFYALPFRIDHTIVNLFDYSIVVGIHGYIETNETISRLHFISKQRMQVEFFFFLCLTSMIIPHVETSGVCSCYCCRSDLCLPSYAGSYYLCFTFNATQCPAFGSPGYANAMCSSASSMFHPFHLLFISFVTLNLT